MEDGRGGVIVAVINNLEQLELKLEVEHVPHHLRPMEVKFVSGQPSSNLSVVQQMHVLVRNSEFWCTEKINKRVNV